MNSIYQKSFLSGVGVGRLRLDDDFRITLAESALMTALQQAESPADAEDPLREWHGAGVRSFLRQAEMIADGACSSLPPRVDDAQQSVGRRLTTWSANLAVTTGGELVEHIEAWWRGGPTDGIVGVQRSRALLTSLTSHRAEREARIALGVAAGKKAKEEADREQAFSMAAAQAIGEQSEVESRLRTPLGVGLAVCGATLMLTILTGESLWVALSFATVTGAGSWGWMKLGWPLLGRSSTPEPSDLAARQANMRLKAALLADWTARAESEGAAAELRALTEVTGKLSTVRGLAPCIKVVELIAGVPTGNESSERPQWLSEQRPGDVAVVSRDAVRGLSITQVGKIRNQLLNAVNGAVNHVVAFGGAPTMDQLVQAVSTRLPDLNVADVLGVVGENAGGREQVVGHLRALVSTVTATAGRLPADLVLDPALAPRTVTFGLPGGLNDPLAKLIERHFPNAAVIAGSNPVAVEVLVDIQNLRFDQLLMAEEAKAAYDKTPEGERRLWHFPALPSTGATGSPSSAAATPDVTPPTIAAVDPPIDEDEETPRPRLRLG